MKLTAVHYELYESDARRLDEEPDDCRHVIDREVRLTFSGGEQVFVSWSQSPVQFAVGYQGHSFFVNDPPIIRDMSGTGMWSPLLGKEVSLRFLDDDHQVLCLESDTATIYFCSYEETWESDVVTITNRAPNMPMQTDDLSGGR